MPCGDEDVLRGVHVGVVLVSAGGALEGRLALAVVRVHMSAGVARLRRVRGRDERDRRPGGARRVAKGEVEQVPSLVQDGPVQSGFGAHSSAGLLAVPLAEAVMFWVRRSSSATTALRVVSVWAVCAQKSARRLRTRPVMALIFALTARRRLLPRLQRESRCCRRRSRFVSPSVTYGRSWKSPLLVVAATLTPGSPRRRRCPASRAGWVWCCRLLPGRRRTSAVPSG